MVNVTEISKAVQEAYPSANVEYDYEAKILYVTLPKDINESKVIATSICNRLINQIYLGRRIIEINKSS